MSKSSTAPLYAAIVALTLWSGTAIANKFAVVHIDPLSAGVLRSLIAGVIALSFCIVFKLTFPASRKHRLLLALSGFTSFALWPALLSVGIQYTTAGHAGLIMATLPVLTVFIASLVNRRMPSWKWWLGAVVALSGATYIVISRTGLESMAYDERTLLGDAIIFGGCFICATGYVAGGKLSPLIGALETTFWGLAVALLLLVPIFLVTYDATQWPTVPTTAWLAIGWMALLSSIAGYGLWFFALGQGGIARIGTLQLLMPMTTLIAASVVLKETLTLSLLAVCLLILGGTYAAHRNSAA